MGFEIWPSFKKFSKKTKNENTDQSGDGNAELNPENSHQESETYKRMKRGLDLICQQHENPDQRVSEIIKKLDIFFRHIDKKVLPNEKINEIRENLQACALISNKDEFVKLVIKAIKPAIDLKETHADKFEDVQAKIMNETGNFIELNRLVSYGKFSIGDNQSIVHLHHTPGETVKYKKSFYIDAMKKLAKIVESDPEVQYITATSWIVGKNPGIFEKAGFKISDLSEEDLRTYHAGDDRKIKRATITRKEFLEKFLKKEK
jgi:hypothetical protein